MQTSDLALRHIRSYVRREGRITPSQRTALNTLWECYGLSIEEGSLQSHHPFISHSPRILEIGFGMGQSLLAMAKQQPDGIFIGIEVHRPGVGALLSGLKKEELTNVRIYCADALEVLKHCIPDDSLDKVQVFFPDPWPKKRHHKRRLVQPDFAALIHQKLKPQGCFHLATDWENYAHHILEVLSAHSGFQNSAGTGNFAPRPSERPLTKFEQRGHKKGHAVHDIIFTKSF